MPRFALLGKGDKVTLVAVTPVSALISVTGVVFVFNLLSGTDVKGDGGVAEFLEVLADNMPGELFTLALLLL